jgi:hypothetical protein
LRHAYYFNIMPIANIFVTAMSVSLKHVKYHGYDTVSKRDTGLTRRGYLRSSTARKAVDGDYTQYKGSKPKDHRQKGKGLSSTPLSAVVAATEGEASPVPGRSAIRTIEPSNEKAKNSGPAGGED